MMRMLNSEFNAYSNSDVDLYPPELREEIDRINDLVYAEVNNGVYRAGFATTQSAYSSALKELLTPSISSRDYSIPAATSPASG